MSKNMEKFKEYFCKAVCEEAQLLTLVGQNFLVYFVLFHRVFVDSGVVHDG